MTASKGISRAKFLSAGAGLATFAGVGLLAPAPSVAGKVEDAAKSGLSGLGDLARDPSQLTDLLNDMKDPETMAEVRKLMSDKRFQKTVTQDPQYKNAVKQAKELAKNPANLQNAQKIAEQALGGATARGGGGAADAGLDALKRTAGNPEAIRRAQEMLKDPKIRSQVESMMRDPKMQQQMRDLAKNPEFANAVRAMQNN